MARYTRAQFLARLEAISPRLRKAFEAAIADITGRARARDLEDAIRRGDVEGAFAALRMDPAAFSGLQDEIARAFKEGGEYQIGTLPDARVQTLAIRFDGNHPRAVENARQQAADLITGPYGFIEEARESVRKVVVAGLEENRPPAQLARDIIGRSSAAGLPRQGGLLGLSDPQVDCVLSMRAALTDPEQMGEYLKDRWTRRDRRFDATVRKAIREGRKLDAAIIDRITGRYSDRLLQLRGETISRTEGLRALNAGRHEAALQMVDRGDIPADAVTLVWDATPSARTRDTHAAMDGQEVPLGQPFTSPSGAQMRFPGDTSLGAPARETINCRCSVRSKVDFTRLAR